MGAGSEGRILTMAEGQVRAATAEWSKSIYSIEAGGSGRLTAGCGAGRAYKIETTGANGWPDGSYRMAGAEIAGTVHKAGEATSRAYTMMEGSQ